MFGEKLKELRLNANLTKTALAKKTGLTQPYITYLEANQREPGANTLCIISEFFGVTTDYLLDREDDLGNVKIPDVSPVLSNDENDLLRFYRAMSDVEKRAIFNTAKAFYSNHSKGKITV